MDEYPDLSPEQLQALDKIADATQDYLFEAGGRHKFDCLEAFALHLGRMYCEVVKQAGGREEMTKAFYKGMADPHQFRPREEEHALRRTLTEVILKDMDAEEKEKKAREKERTISDIELDYMNAYEYFEREKRVHSGPDLSPAAEAACRLLKEYQDAGGPEREWVRGSGICVKTAMAGLERFQQEFEITIDGAVIERKESAPSEPVAQVKEPCPKCKGTGNMGFTTYMRCTECG